MTEEADSLMPHGAVQPKEYTSSADGVVEIIVGENKQKFVVHKQLITSLSPYFAKCLDSDRFVEGSSGKITMVEDDADAFGLLTDWMYGRKLDIKDSSRIATATKAYVLADKLLMISCKNDIIDCIRKLYRGEYIDATHLSSSQIGDLPEGSPVQQYLIDQYSHDLLDLDNEVICADKHHYRLHSNDRGLVQAGGHHVAEIFDSVVVAARFGKFLPNPSHTAGCVYHDHSDGSRCQALKDAAIQIKNEKIDQ